MPRGATPFAVRAPVVRRLLGLPGASGACLSCTVDRALSKADGDARARAVTCQDQDDDLHTPRSEQARAVSEAIMCIALRKKQTARPDDMNACVRVAPCAGTC